MILREVTTKGSLVTRMKRVFEQARFSSERIFNLSLPNALLFERVTGIIVVEISCDLATRMEKRSLKYCR